VVIKHGYVVCVCVCVCMYIYIYIYIYILQHVTETMAYVLHVAQELRASGGLFQYTILPR
jgi:hypothetical protein